jgi:hypothetical protein
MKSNKIILILLIFSVFWSVYSVYNINYRLIHFFIINAVTSPVGVALIYYTTKNREGYRKYKKYLCYYFIVYGLLWCIYDCYQVISGNLEVGSIYLISDVTVLYLSIKLYNKKLML